MTSKATLQRLKDRYFRSVMAHPEGHLGHHADCNIYSHEHTHCDCGLIHDLDIINFADKLYASYFNDYRKSRGLKKLTKEELEKISAEFDKLFVKNLSESEPNKNEDIQEWILIEEVFGSGFRQRREKEWVTQEDKIGV